MRTHGKATGAWARDVAHFGHWAPRYERSLLQRVFLTPIQTATIAEIGREVSQPQAILDIGCGTGVLLRHLAGSYPLARLVGVDAAAGMIRQAQAAVPNGLSLSFAEARAEQLPFADGTFDLVVSTMSFHHWADQQLGLHEVRRVLGAEGCFVLTDVVVDPWLSWAFAASGDRIVTARRLEAMLAAASLRRKRSASAPGFGLRHGRMITVARPGHLGVTAQ
jgi:ubiquinone/menaquinone biosynthesis C-methylase UbiE